LSWNGGVARMTDIHILAPIRWEYLFCHQSCVPDAIRAEVLVNQGAEDMVPAMIRDSSSTSCLLWGEVEASRLEERNHLLLTMENLAHG